MTDRLAYTVPADRHGMLDFNRAGKSHIVDHGGYRLCDEGLMVPPPDGIVQTLRGDATDNARHSTCKRCLKRVAS